MDDEPPAGPDRRRRLRVGLVTTALVLAALVLVLVDELGLPPIAVGLTLVAVCVVALLGPQRGQAFYITDPHLPPSRRTPPSDVLARFRAACAAQHDPDLAGPELLPVRLARACAEVLHADGAGLSVLNGEFRVPLGASSEEAGLAERLQFTQGEGPCLVAARELRTVSAGPAALDLRWPAFAAELADRTPYRAVMAVPLLIDAGTTGALDLFFVDPLRAGGVGAGDVTAVTGEITAALADARHVHDDPAARWAMPEPRWLHGRAAVDRSYVWVATGMVMSRGDMGAPDALSLLRARAYGTGSTLDELAIALTDGSVDLDDLEV